MRRLPGMIATLAPAMLLVSCSPPPIDIAVDAVDGQLRVGLSQQWGLIVSHGEAPCVREIGLRPAGDGGRPPVWRAVANGDVQCVHGLSAFVVGQAPEGFSSVIPWSRPAPGPYVLDVSGIGWGMARVTVPHPVSLNRTIQRKTTGAELAPVVSHGQRPEGPARETSPATGPKA